MIEDSVEGAEGTYVVSSEDPGHPGVVLFMVDRRKQKQSFWSNRLTDVFVLRTKEVADFHATRLKFNKPKSLPWDEALKVQENNVLLLRMNNV